MYRDVWDYIFPTVLFLFFATFIGLVIYCGSEDKAARNQCDTICMVEHEGARYKRMPYKGKDYCFCWKGGWVPVEEIRDE